MLIIIIKLLFMHYRIIYTITNLANVNFNNLI